MIDIAWASGLFEGEGSIVYTKIPERKNSYRTSVSIASSDLDVIEKFRDIVGLGTVRAKPIVENHKPMFYWQVTNYRDCLYIVGLFYKYLGSRRRIKADQIIEAALSRL